MRYLLDTTVVIDWTRGYEPAGEILRRLVEEGHDLYSCDVVVCESLSGGSDSERDAAWSLLQALEYVALDPEGARWAGGSRQRRGVGGNIRSLGDSLIAAVAWRLGATIVTRNSPDFARQGVPILEYGVG